MNDIKNDTGLSNTINLLEKFVVWGIIISVGFTLISTLLIKHQYSKEILNMQNKYETLFNNVDTNLILERNSIDRNFATKTELLCASVQHHNELNPLKANIETNQQDIGHLYVRLAVLEVKNIKLTNQLDLITKHLKCHFDVKKATPEELILIPTLEEVTTYNYIPSITTMYIQVYSATNTYCSTNLILENICTNK